HATNTIYIGNGAINGDTSVIFKAGSPGSANLETGSLFYNTSDQFEFSGGDVLVDNNLLVTGTINSNTFTSTALTFAGSSPVISTTANNDLTLTPNGSGNTIITSDFNSGLLVGSSGNTIAP